jgi:phosphoribosylformylglycinamidine cyclo-ligase
LEPLSEKSYCAQRISTFPRPWKSWSASGVKALINITSDGLLNLARVEAKVGFEIDRLFEPQPIFALIQRHANVDDSEMFEVFNMGIGFCYVVDPNDVALTISILEKHDRKAQRVGYAVADPEQHVRIHEPKLLGHHKTFRLDGRSVRKVG